MASLSSTRVLATRLACSRGAVATRAPERHAIRLAAAATQRLGREPRARHRMPGTPAPHAPGSPVPSPIRPTAAHRRRDRRHSAGDEAPHREPMPAQQACGSAEACRRAQADGGAEAGGAAKPAGDTAQVRPAQTADAPLRDAYHQAPRDTVTQAVYDGWKQYNLNCARCHGEDVMRHDDRAPSHRVAQARRPHQYQGAVHQHRLRRAAREGHARLVRARARDGQDPGRSTRT